MGGRSGTGPGWGTCGGSDRRDGGARVSRVAEAEGLGDGARGRGEYSPGWGPRGVGLAALTFNSGQ